MRRGLWLSVLAALMGTCTLFADLQLTFDERVEAQRAIERVYYQHQIWPKDNPEPKPSFEKAVSEDILRQKVENYLLKAMALQEFWDHTLTAEDLQQELNRISRETRNPRMLKDLFDALNNNPRTIAECIARPILTERLFSNWFAWDERIHASLKEDLNRQIATLDPLSFPTWIDGDYEKITIFNGSLSSADSDRSYPGRVVVSADSFSELKAKILQRDGVLTLEEKRDRFIIRRNLSISDEEIESELRQYAKINPKEWLSRHSDYLDYSKLRGVTSAGDMELRSPIVGEEVPDSWRMESFVPVGRSDHSAVWTGTEMIIWGGFCCGDSFFGTGARYNPTTDTWTPTSMVNAPSPRAYHTAIWTGNEMVIWGGGDSDEVFNTGGIYDPVNDTWTATNTSDPDLPSARMYHSAVWTGRYMLIWGGNEGGYQMVTDTGGRYIPYGTWVPMNSTDTDTPSARQQHTAVWTGREMIIWGGIDNIYPPATLGGIYDPGLDSWRGHSTTGVPAGRTGHSAVYTGTRMIIWGGNTGGLNYTNTGGLYNPESDVWEAIPATGIPSARSKHSTVWTGNEMLIWGGEDISGELSDGDRLVLNVNRWFNLSSTNAPEARKGHAAVWTGKYMIVWGGTGYSLGFDTGARYNLINAQWTPTAVSDSGEARYASSAVWTGNYMVVWGGRGMNGALQSGNRYDPATNTWTDMPVDTSTPEARVSHIAVWDGDDMLIWGGASGATGLNSGSAYDPISNTWWMDLSSTDAPTGRWSHTGVWSGTEMIIWGGSNGGMAPLGDGAKYSKSLDEWSPVAVDANTPSARDSHTAVWSGSQMLIWGGWDWSTCLNTGGRYTPGNPGSWQTMTTTNAPIQRRGHTAVWTGSEMIIWGGADQAGMSFTYLNNGGRYTPGGAWIDVDDTDPDTPSPRLGHSAVWTGREMIIWGGSAGFYSFIGDGGRYDPSISDLWKPVGDPDNQPAERWGHTALWTNKEMIIVGGEPARGLALYYTDTDPVASMSLSTSIGGDHSFGLGLSEELTLNGAFSTSGSNPYSDPSNEDTYDSLSEYFWFLNQACTDPLVFHELEGSSPAPLSESDLASYGMAEIGTYPVSLQVRDINGTTSCEDSTLTVVDGLPPSMNLIVPNGGESWTYSPDVPPRHNHLVAWNALDNLGLDRVRISYTTQSDPGGSQNAVYNATYGAPACLTIPSSCDTLTLVESRDTIAVKKETNQPNTLDGCSDGTSGTYHVDISVDRIRIYTSDGSPFMQGKTVTVEVTAWINDPGANRVDIFHAPDAAGPEWSLVASFTPSTTGIAVFTGSFVLPSSPLQAVRAQIRYKGMAVPCMVSANNINDRDDLVFAVGPTWTCIADSYDPAECPALNLDGSDTLEITDQTFWWTMPTLNEAASDNQVFPSATSKIKVDVWDESGNHASDTSD
nr:hypothetical protein [Thermoanaerobaculia bacterium]HXK69244.1 hypothetical protein [Thermoanaerobaculia bacterium]